MTRRAFSLCMIAVALTLASLPRLAAAAEEPKEILDKAIKATGGAEAIAKQKAMIWKDKGTYHGMGSALEFTGESAAQWPNRYRMEIVGAFATVLDGDKGWVSAQGQVRDMSEEEVAVSKEQNRLAWIATLLPLKEQGYKLSAADEAKVNDKPAAGIKASLEGKPDVTLWFDNESNLLVRVKSTVKSQEQGKEVEQEVTYSDFKEFEGVKMPTKYVITHDGKKFVEGEMTEVKILDKLDEKLFQKP